MGHSKLVANLDHGAKLKVVVRGSSITAAAGVAAEMMPTLPATVHLCVL